MQSAQPGLEVLERSAQDSRQRGLIGAGAPSPVGRDAHLDVNEEPPRLVWTHCQFSVKLMCWITMLFTKVSQSFNIVGKKINNYVYIYI